MAILTPQQIKRLKSSPIPDSGNRVHAAIALAEVTQLDVAAGTGFSQPYVSDVARGRNATITVENAHRFASYFGCSLDDLFPSREAVAS